MSKIKINGLNQSGCQRPMQ